MLQFTTEITLCCIAIISSKSKEEIDLFEHQAGLPFELFAHPGGEMLEEEVLSQKIKRKKDCPKP